jgi:hypothetical protein
LLRFQVFMAANIRMTTFFRDVTLCSLAETPVNFYDSTQHSIPEDNCHLHFTVVFHLQQSWDPVPCYIYCFQNSSQYSTGINLMTS